MEFISVFNDVLGPVMRGPSSSHTAGSYRIARIARSLLGEKPRAVRLTFDPAGSYAQTYREQGADLGFAAGFLEWPMTDKRFRRALEVADRAGISLEFKVSSLKKPAHPNTVRIWMSGERGQELTMEAQSVGGGLVLVTRVEDWEVQVNGKSFDLLIEVKRGKEGLVKAILNREKKRIGPLSWKSQGDLSLVHARSSFGWKEETLGSLSRLEGICRVWSVVPIFFVERGKTLFTEVNEMVALAQDLGNSLGRAAIRYESTLLGLFEAKVRQEMLERWMIMEAAVKEGLRRKDIPMKLLKSSAGQILRAISRGKAAFGGIHGRAAARAMAALHVASSGGVICAAPTGASSGVIPGVLVTLAEEKGLSQDEILRALFAASAVGLVIARRATFAAEIAGCQVEIGAAAAMAAAAVVEAVAGTAREACDAAAISLQNTMGSACDLVQGICEIPCHTRTAVAAASAFVCADLVRGGYKNPIPLDETVDAVFSTGKMLPAELRCTSRGGIATAPSAQKLRQRKSS